MEYTEIIQGICGCLVITEPQSSPEIVYCPLHKSAPKLYEALKEVIAEFLLPENFINKYKGILAKAKGK